MKVASILASCDLLDYLPPQTKLRSVGRDRWRGRCPIGDHSEGGFAVYRHRDGHLEFRCFACNEHGNVIHLVALLERTTIGATIRKLSDGKTGLSPAAVMQRAKDSFDKQRGAYVLMCVAPRCLAAPLQLEDELEAALALSMSGHAQHWEVSPSGEGALCPEHR